MPTSVILGAIDCSSIGMAVRSTSTILDVGSRVYARALGLSRRTRMIAAPVSPRFAIRLQCGACASGTARVWTCNLYCQRWRSILVMLGRKAPTGISPPRQTS